MTQKCNLDHLSKWIMTFNRPRSFEFSVVIVIRIDDPDQQPTTLIESGILDSDFTIEFSPSKARLAAYSARLRAESYVMHPT